MLVSAFLLCLTTIAGASAAQVDWLSLDGAEYKRIDDPIFGGEIAVIEAGPQEASTVVLIHGLGDNASRDWKKTIPVLAETHHVVAVDLPGFGRSSKGNHLYSPERLARSVQAVVSELASERIVLVGHSMGAAIALAYADLYPEEVEQLMLVDMAGVLHRSVYTAFLGMQGARWITGNAIDENSWLGELVSTVAASIEDAAITHTLLLNSALLRSQILGGEPSTIAAYALVTHDFSAALWELHVPTLVVWGREDAVAPLRTGKMAAGVIPGARLEILDDVGHVPMLTAPETFNQLVLQLLSGRFESAAYKLTSQVPGDGRTVSCKNDSGRRFSGNIERLHLQGCAKTLVENANIGRIEIVDSTVSIENSHIFEGIEAAGSKVSITAGSVRGEPPMILRNTDVDAAGTAFHGDGHLVENAGSIPVTVTFSVSRQISGSPTRPFLHDIIPIPANGKH